MLALNEQQRRFVVGYIGSGGKNASRVARAAGYAASGARVKACDNLRLPKIILALKEESERRFDRAAVDALLGLSDLVAAKNPKVRAAAIDSVLDRTGYSRKVTQDIRVEHVDTRSTAEILAAVQKMFGPAASAPQIVDATYREVETVDAHAEA